MKVKPLKNRLLIELVEQEKETKSGIILTGHDSNDIRLARIVETADCYDDNCEILLKGDKLLVNPSIATKVNVDGKEYYIIDQKEVLATVR